MQARTGPPLALAPFEAPVPDAAADTDAIGRVITGRGVAPISVEGLPPAAARGFGGFGFRRLLALSLSLVAIGSMPAVAEQETPSPAHQPPVPHHVGKSPDQHRKTSETDKTAPVPPVSVPHIGLGVEDDGAVTSNDPNLVNSVLSSSKNMGARWLRIMMHPDQIEQDGWSGYDSAVASAEAKGLNVSITASCEKVSWTEQSFYQYIATFARRYSQTVHQYGICNEPNYEHWLRRMPGMSVAQTYRRLYQAGYRAIKDNAPDSTVLYGEFSSERDPISFMHRVARCPKPHQKCPALPVDKVAYHPYQLSTPPTRPSAKGRPGIGSLAIVEAEIHKEYQAGKIKTPEGHEPKISLDEFGYWVSLRGESTNPYISPNARKRYVPEQLRQQYYEQALHIVCRNPKIVQFFLYGWTPPPQGSQNVWDTALVSPEGKPLPSNNRIRRFAENHRCIKQ